MKNKCDFIIKFSIKFPDAFPNNLPAEQANHVQNCSDCQLYLKQSKSFEKNFGNSLKSERLPDVNVNVMTKNIMKDYNKIIKPEYKQTSFFERIIEFFSAREFVPSLSVAALMLIILFSGYYISAYSSFKPVAYIDKSAETRSRQIVKIASENNKIEKKVNKIKDDSFMTIAKLSGKVEILRNGAIISNKIKENFSLLPGDIIRTGNGNSSCQIASSISSYNLTSSTSIAVYPNNVILSKGTADFRFKSNSYSPAAPFIIETNKSSIYILGTELNVKTVENANEADVIKLTKGKIGISLKNTLLASSLRAVPGDIIEIDSQIVKVNGTSLRNEDQPVTNKTNNLASNNSSTAIAAVPGELQDTQETASLTQKNKTDDTTAATTNEPQVNATITTYVESDFPDEGQWLKNLIDSTKELKYYNNMTRAELHSLYMNAKAAYEAKKNK